ncbi:acyl-[acyl-carrier-protein]--UDP-N-acetylglucosamine O-acyltransferase [Deltaproteobacteria bacterium]|nr:acyl-[acyl-carrier-protein]--UDP-N-acetylglucosamine O-acyltransferase [Deltaproteobacteria bacterium]
MAIHPTAIVDPRAQLGADVELGPYAVIEGAVKLGARVQVHAHGMVRGDTEIGADSKVYSFACIGGDPQDLKYRGEPTRLVVGERNSFREFTTVNRGTASGGAITRIGNDNLFMANTHVAHDCTVGDHCVFANSVAIAGHVTIQDRVVLGGLAAVHQQGRIGRCAMVGGGGMAAQDVPPFTIAQGDRARLVGLNVVGLRRAGFSREVMSALKNAYRELFQAGMPLRIAAEQVRAFYNDVPEVIELVDFLETSQRGICRSVGAPDAADE